eukprot:2541247-Prymnesium_polylepis.1
MPSTATISSLCMSSARRGLSASGPPSESQYVCVMELHMATTSARSTNCRPRRSCILLMPRSTFTALDGRGGVE